MYACLYNTSASIILNKDIIFSRMILRVEMMCREVDVAMSIEFGPVCIGKIDMKCGLKPLTQTNTSKDK